MMYKLFGFYTEKNEFLEIKDIKRIVAALSKFVKDNKNKLEILEEDKHNIKFIHKKSISLKEQFGFITNAGKNKHDLLAEDIMGIERPLFVVTHRGVLALNIITTNIEEYSDLILCALRIVRKESGNKISYMVFEGNEKKVNF